MNGDGLTLTDHYPELAEVNALPGDVATGESPPLANPTGRGIGFFFQSLDQYLVEREAAAAMCGPMTPRSDVTPVVWDIFSRD